MEREGNEENVSTEPGEASTDPWISSEDEHSERTEGVEQAAAKGSQAAGGFGALQAALMS